MVYMESCSKIVPLSYPLSIIFNIVYNSGNVPIEWKLANVVPVFKKGDKKLVTNYRPISLTCLVAKVMERIIQEDLLNRTQHLINNFQHGFMFKKSCDTIWLV